MGSSEPTLVPEWLRCNGHGNSAGSASHSFGSANNHSDVPLLANSVRNKPSRSFTEVDNSHAIFDRSSSINSRRNASSNGSSKHPYSSFSRSHRDTEHEKERSALGSFWEHDSFDPLGKDSMRRTRSMASRKQGDLLPRRVASDSQTIESNIHLHRNGPAARDKSANSLPKVLFEKDFPSLGAEEKQGVPNVVRVASPGLAAHTLPIGTSALIGEGWSALAEVPVVTGSNNSAQTIHQPVVTSVSSSSASGGLNAASGVSNTNSGVSNTALVTSNTASWAPKTTCASGPASGLNMAEALVQPPSVTRTATQLLVETQRIEQLAIKKVRQLTPLTPAMPKILNSSDKLKAKLNARVGEVIGATQVAQQLPSSSLNAVSQSPRGGPVTSDPSKQSHGSKLFVLKPPWENGGSASPKDRGSNSENNVGDLLATPTTSSAPVRCANSSKSSIMERKAVVSSLSMPSTVEKRPLSSHAQSRSDFFKSVRKKNLVTTTVTPETGSPVHSPSEEKSCELLKQMTCASQQGTENGGLISKADSSNEARILSLEGKNSISRAEVISDEEEAAFLRSLGWEDNGEEEEEGLTEEEINAFYQEVMKSRPTLNLSQGMQPTLSLLTESHASNVGGTSPRVSSSDAGMLH
ncbi:unnamed protein product [Rhodiola kirilowii]